MIVSLRNSLFVMMLFLSAGQSQGADLINTLSATDELEEASLSGFFVAQSFDTTVIDRMITSVTLKLRTDATDGTFRVDIYDATGGSGSPGSMVANIHDSDLTGISTGSFADFVIDGLSLVLDPSSTYYVVASAGVMTPDQTGLYWQFTYAAPAGSGGETSIYWDSENSTTWTNQLIGEPQLMRVTATAVPEPSTYALGCIATLALSVVARRRSNVAKRAVKV